jgi:nucleotidyltransferase-like protein
MPELTAPWVEPVHLRLRAGRLLIDTCRMGAARARFDPHHLPVQGEATYFLVRSSDVRLWTYRHPDPEAAAIAGHAAAGEHPGACIIVDGVPERWQ